MFFIFCSNIVFCPFFLFSGVRQLIVEGRHIRVAPLTVCSVKVHRDTVCSDAPLCRLPPFSWPLSTLFVGNL